MSVNLTAQVKWTGSGGDGQWTTASNWTGNQLPGATDDILLDNSLMPGNYTVFLPGLAIATTIKSITISPAAGNNIQLTLSASNTAAPALTVTGPGYGITINNGGMLVNSSGSSSTASIAVTDSVKINNGGQYTHNTRSAHAALVTVLSKQPGTEKGIFKFDVPGGGYTFASTNRTYGTLILSADASGGSQAYASSAASPLTVNGDFVIKTGVTVNLDITAATAINGNYIQEGGIFNLASQPNNNTVYIKGDLNQSSGTITETSGGLPAIELNGTNNQNIKVIGNITNSIDFRINNPAGVTMTSALSLPYKLSLLNGVVHALPYFLTLLTGCSVDADSTSSTSFVSGALRKEGLSAASNFLFPVGEDGVQRWIELKNATGTYTIEFFKSNPNIFSTVTGTGVHHISSIEYWSVNADVQSVATAAVALSFDNVNSGGVTDMATLRVVELVAGTWTDQGNTATTGTAGSAGSVVSSSLNTFGPGVNYFTLASSDAFQNPLPLKLISFTGYSNNIVNILNWTIEPYWQPASLELQSSSNGVYFSFLSKIHTDSSQLGYQYTDKREVSGPQYYRLKAIEKDGTIFYSGNIEVAPYANIIKEIQLRPSVVKNNTILFINAGAEVHSQINIYNPEGKLVDARDLILQVGKNYISILAEHLAVGVYTVRIVSTGNKISITRFLKLR
ncbi:MAG: hypothetical protein ABJB86_03415 [Bacteroidota bacterium]